MEPTIETTKAKLEEVALRFAMGRASTDELAEVARAHLAACEAYVAGIERLVDGGIDLLAAA